ncbi:hypothetical protein UQW22_11390 [Isoptericola halotolerans]|uniref:hypothetical protein n=1 Tax=Isoptericola halotolerans TaxID=300560 RepID=UPI003890E619
MTAPKHQVQWFVTGQGAVLQASAPVDDPGARTYVRYEASRPVDLDTLYALEERFATFRARSDKGTGALLVLLGVAAVGVVAGWLVLPWLGVSDDVAGTLLVASAVVLALAFLASAVLPGLVRRHVERMYVDSGLVSAVPRALRRTQAEELVAAPGTAAGHVSLM